MSKKYCRGFTLIELSLYMALFSILIGGVVVSVYNIMESKNRDETQTELVEEGGFLLGKMRWLLSGVDTINAPALNTSGTTLSVITLNTSSGEPIIIRISNQKMTLQTGTNAVEQLNTDTVWISNAIFTYNSIGQDTPAESIKANFTINARTPSGTVVSQNFSETYYPNE